MTLAYQLIDFKNPVFLAYTLWSVTLALKMMYLSMHTAIFRFKNQTFANPEDGGRRNVHFNNEEVERVRRAHRNDMENILPAFLIGLLYVLIEPSTLSACLLFKIGAIARIIHTVVYAIVVIPQPARVLAFAIHYIITIYMGVSVLYHLF
ncbi:microsomal glutathione S-transferase 1-like [Sitodiplosis mosellana]|uniref:microsomal glutathione S-transferase 1-like n=1 Tax=Sitodiplosis mosellana TaxID=263140 RepID=UPI002443B1F3|nr:microsomal glutathione S-transferase 1-like [Sitodiplosis mosellana]